MMKRLLITGAAGGLGAMCRERLTHLAKQLSFLIGMVGCGRSARGNRLLRFGRQSGCRSHG